MTDTFNDVGTVYKVELYDRENDQVTTVFTHAGTQAAAARKVVDGYSQYHRVERENLSAELVEEHDAEIAV